MWLSVWWCSYNGSTLACEADGAGSIPVHHPNFQWSLNFDGEALALNQLELGSSPRGTTNLCSRNSSGRITGSYPVNESSVEVQVLSAAPI